MSTFTPAEQRAYAEMQARLIALLLRHDETRFQQFFDQRREFDHERDSDSLQHYRELGVLFHLRNMLFEHILPRIVRRLSFESPRSVIIEEPPGRGRIDWERTLDATWAERPGEVPLMVYTRQRRRDFATPENLLTVIILLEYHSDIQWLLWSEHAVIGTEALRHPLNDIIERCERELAFPQFAGLRQVAQRVIEGEQGGPEALEVQVQERLIPGSNGAYEELLDWRRQRRSLRLLHRHPVAQSDDVLGADPRRDNYLYQLWIFFELADLLRDREQLVHLDTTSGSMYLRFRWGTEDTICEYELRHDQSVPDPIVRWKAVGQSVTAPGVRPDFYLRRVDPPIERIEYKHTMYWREPGLIWDAKYYRERDNLRAPSTPIKRMIADLTLLGEPHGVLLFAFLANREALSEAMPAEAGGIVGEEWPGSYKLVPDPTLDQTLGSGPTVTNVQLCPTSDPSLDKIRFVLVSLLNQMHTRLHQPIVPQCYGIFLDTLSIANRHQLLDRYGNHLDGNDHEILICPKPHIGSWRVDLVSRERHCCQDGAFCQIINRPGSTKPIRPPRTAQDLLRELQHVFSKQDVLDEEMVSAIARQVEGITRRFAEIAGAYRTIDVYYNRLRDLGLAETLDLLGASERESLALAIFLVEQLDSIGANDYSAPAIHISSVMEIEVKHRVFACPNLVGDLAQPKRHTLGVLPYIRRKPEDAEGNWEVIVAYVAQHWQGQIDPDEQERVITFDEFVTKALSRISQIRNMAAHTEPVSRKDYADLQRIMFQGGRLGYGALNVLVRAWH